MWITELPMVMIRCLTITIILETVLAIIIGIREKRDIPNVILVNIATNPLVVAVPVYFEFYHGTMTRMVSLVILELFAFAFEGVVYDKCLKNKKINGFVLSLILNLFSYLSGIIINHFIYT